MDGPKSLKYYLDLFQGRTIVSQDCRNATREHQLMQGYIESWSENWQSMISVFNSTMAPMFSKIRVVGLVPARNESNRIQGLLNAIHKDVETSQASELFELIILENGTKSEIGELSKVLDCWIKNIKPKFKIHLISYSWDEQEKHPLAKARKILADLAIFRSVQRIPVSPLYLLTEDADIENVQSGRLKYAINLLDKNPSIDAIRGIQERTLWAMQANNLALLERRSWQITELLFSSARYSPDKNSGFNFYWHRVVTAGSNVFFTAEAYCIIGGYSEDVALFEDMDIGQRISVIRGTFTGNKFIPNVNTIKRFPFREESNIARILLSLSNDRHLYNHGNDASGFYNVDHIIKTPDSIHLLLKGLEKYSKISLDFKWRFEKLLSDLYKEIHRIFSNSQEEASGFFHRVMFYLGLSHYDYQIDGVNIIIKRVDTFTNILSSFSNSKN